MKFFYTHLVEIETIVVSLDELDLTDEQKRHLSGLVDSNIHATILNLVLSNLNEKDKETFLEYFQKRDHDKIWQLLKQKIENIEEQIRKEIKNLKEQLHKDLKEAKTIKAKL